MESGFFNVFSMNIKNRFWRNIKTELRIGDQVFLI
jgi:hypothetical protein